MTYVKKEEFSDYFDFIEQFEDYTTEQWLDLFGNGIFDENGKVKPEHECLVSCWEAGEICDAEDMVKILDKRFYDNSGRYDVLAQYANSDKVVFWIVKNLKPSQYVRGLLKNENGVRPGSFIVLMKRAHELAPSEFRMLSYYLYNNMESDRYSFFYSNDFDPEKKNTWPSGYAWDEWYDYDVM